MNQHQATPQALRAMLKKAQQKPAAARKDIEFGFFGEASSRAYYAAFHAVSAVLARNGLAFSSHAQTLAAFNREFVKTGVLPSDTFRKFQRVFEDRQVADYDWTREVDKQTAQKNLDDAQWLVDARAECLEKAVGQSLQDTY
jgi:uncharacterized protein (UPF0332 family)